MIVVAMPVGSHHGWGIVGKGVIRAMDELTGGTTRLVTQPVTPDAIGDELELQAILALLLKPEERPAAQVINGVTHLDCPLITCTDQNFLPWSPQVKGKPTLGHAVFEENLIKPALVQNMLANYDLIAASSTWCTEILQGLGVPNVHTVNQGIDPRLFFPIPEPLAEQFPPREYLKDRFVIFSGGKFEIRKSQDIVIRAIKVLQDRHPDVFLVNAWFNPWQSSFDTMKGSPHLRWPTGSGPYTEVMNQILAFNGLDLKRVLTLGPRLNPLMPRIYRNSDVGLFPNRCEGGTNLVMMEYMACGKPVVATGGTGHADIVNAGNALIIATPTENIFNNAGNPVARWPEPSLEDTIEKLEYAYQNRDHLQKLGDQAGIDMTHKTWMDTARGFVNLLPA